MSEYIIPAGYGEAEYVDKKSRFIGQVQYARTEAEAMAFVESVRKKYADATHNVWAYVLNSGAMRWSDDGEPGGTSGQPTLNVFRSAGVSDVCCVVTRYFGGILLGSGGLVRAYTAAIGDVAVDESRFSWEEMEKNRLYMPDALAAGRAEKLLEERMAEADSAGGIVECRIWGMPVGVGEPVFEKLDANLAKAMMSIGAVKGVEIGDGFQAASSRGSENNDHFYMEQGQVRKRTNHSGGILGGMSDGAEIRIRAAIKPTPSIARSQRTVTRSGEERQIAIKGRHDPVIVPRAVVVVESMAALTAADMLLLSMTSRLDRIQSFFGVPASEE